MQQATRTMFWIQPIARCTVDFDAITIMGPIETETDGLQQITFIATQRPGQ